MSGDDIVLPLRLHPTRFWLLLPVSFPGRTALRLVLDSGSPVSAMSGRALGQLVSEGNATVIRGERYLVCGLSVEGVAIPDMTVRAGGPAERIDADGLVGLDYLSQFSRVCVDIPALELTLTPPAA